MYPHIYFVWHHCNHLNFVCGRIRGAEIGVQFPTRIKFYFFSCKLPLFIATEKDASGTFKSGMFERMDNVTHAVMFLN
jgi:hypothetical protein